MAAPNELRRPHSQTTFERDVPTDIPAYRYRRQQREEYGRIAGTFRSGSPEQLKHQRYHDHQDASKEAKRVYGVARTEAKKDYVALTEGNEDMKKYYNETSEELLPEQHRELLPPAYDWESNAYKHAEGRAEFLVQHPVAFTNTVSQKRHWNAASQAYVHHKKVLDAFNQHQRYASDPNDTRRDLYGKEVTKSHRPTPFPYPSFQPQQGEYSQHYVPLPSRRVPPPSTADNPPSNQQVGAELAPPTFSQGFAIPRPEMPAKRHNPFDPQR